MSTIFGFGSWSPLAATIGSLSPLATSTGVSVDPMNPTVFSKEMLQKEQAIKKSMEQEEKESKLISHYRSASRRKAVAEKKGRTDHSIKDRRFKDTEMTEDYKSFLMTDYQILSNIGLTQLEHKSPLEIRVKDETQAAQLSGIAMIMDKLSSIATEIDVYKSRVVSEYKMEPYFPHTEYMLTYSLVASCFKAIEVMRNGGDYVSELSSGQNRDISDWILTFSRGNGYAESGKGNARYQHLWDTYYATIDKLVALHKEMNDIYDKSPTLLELRETMQTDKHYQPADKIKPIPVQLLDISKISGLRVYSGVTKSFFPDADSLKRFLNGEVRTEFTKSFTIYPVVAFHFAGRRYNYAEIEELYGSIHCYENLRDQIQKATESFGVSALDDYGNLTAGNFLLGEQETTFKKYLDMHEYYYKIIFVMDINEGDRIPYVSDKYSWEGELLYHLGNFQCVDYSFIPVGRICVLFIRVIYNNIKEYKFPSKDYLKQRYSRDIADINRKEKLYRFVSSTYSSADIVTSLIVNAVYDKAYAVLPTVRGDAKAASTTGLVLSYKKSKYSKSKVGHSKKGGRSRRRRRRTHKRKK